MSISPRVRQIATDLAVAVVAICLFGWMFGVWQAPEGSALIDPSVQIVSEEPNVPAHPAASAPAQPEKPKEKAPENPQEKPPAETPKTDMEKSGVSYGSGTVIGHSNYNLVAGRGVTHSIILTNEHVLSSLSTVNVYWKGHKILGHVISRDHETDLALVEVPVVLPKAEMYFGPLDLGVEEWVVGYPYGEGISITRGYVSTMDRQISLRQGTASVWPGNSGGGLFILQRTFWGGSRFVLAGVVDAVYMARPSPIQRTIVNTIGYSISMDNVMKFLKNSHVAF